MGREGFGTRAVASPQPVEAAAKARTLVAAALIKKRLLLPVQVRAVSQNIQKQVRRDL